ncbi:MAG: threonylcarbamoyl-AMP synthase [Bacilli bacterium]|nr:threonylcarbamoyl-AMP synthase [Bacilli bacterium]
MNKEELVKVLKKGGIAVIPTDTVYGIVCDALNEEAVDKVYQLKKRSYKKPMVILVSDMEMLKEYTKSLSRLEKKLYDTFAPGPLTVLVKKADSIPEIVTSGLEDVGIRIPDDKDLQEAIAMLGHPIVATSANISSSETITRIELLEDSIRKNVDFIYDGGTIYRGASTIVREKDHMVEIVRNGDLTENIQEEFKVL